MRAPSAFSGNCQGSGSEKGRVLFVLNPELYRNKLFMFLCCELPCKRTRLIRHETRKRYTDENDDITRDPPPGWSDISELLFVGTVHCREICFRRFATFYKGSSKTKRTTRLKFHDHVDLHDEKCTWNINRISHSEQWKIHVYDV